MLSLPLPGARESSAGDEFHVLWAVRRVLGLLDTDSGLQRVVMEDLTPEAVEGLDPELVLGADLTEYYGGAQLSTADRVVITQLKYSHRNPQRAWTAARVAEPNARGSKGVIARLADLYRGLAAVAARDLVVERVAIRLVSNQPCSTALSHALTHAQAWLEPRPQQTQAARLLQALSSADRSQIERMRGAAGLGSVEFTDFLRLLDLSGLGSDSLAEQDLRVTGALAHHVMFDLRHASLAVADLVRRRGLPEGQGRPIDRDDVLAALDVHSELDLLPAPARFNRPTPRISTPDAARIAEALTNSPDRRLVAHGPAGVGKTTTILGLEEVLPAGSVVLRYDCFGDGDFETPAAARHLPVRFALHLCNELAVRCRLPILVKPASSIHDLWRELERRIGAAAAVLATSGAKLLLVVDAADNSAYAGRRFAEDTFLTQLWAQPIPDGAGLVVTCRTGRRDALRAPNDIAELQLSGFDEAASAEHLRTRFPAANDDTASLFHRNSRGNPRVQFYVLSERPGAPDTAEEAAAQADLTPDDLFDSLLETAVAQAPNVDDARDRLAELVCLTKPLTTTQFRSISGMAADRVRAFCEALEPGVVIEGTVIAFRDEDFATFLRESVGEDEQVRAHGRLADFFMSRADDPEACAVLADHLHNADRHEELVELALAGAPAAVGDALLRQQVYRRRLNLALRHAADTKDRQAACRLVVLAADAARQNSAVAEMLRRRPDLGMRYSDPEAVMRVYTDGADAEWQGQIRMQLAGFYAAAGDHPRARIEARAASAWLDRRHDEDRHWTLEPDDVGAYAEAWFHVRGPDAAEAFLRSWSPVEFARSAAVALVRRIAQSDRAGDVGRLIATRDLPVAVRAELLAAAFGAGAPISRATARAIAELVIATPPSRHKNDEWWRATFAELCAFVGLSRRLVLQVLNALALPRPGRAPRKWERLTGYRDYLRQQALRASAERRPLTLDMILPTSLTDPPDSPAGSRDVSDERRLMTENVAAYVDVFYARAMSLLTRPSVEELRQGWHEHLERRHGSERHPSDEPDFGYRLWLAAFVDALLACRGVDTTLLDLATDAAWSVAPSAAHLSWLSAAHRLVRDARYQRSALRLIDRAANAVDDAEWPASEKANALLRACAVAAFADDGFARDLHARAIRAAEGMDDDAIGRLEMHARILEGVRGCDEAAAMAWRAAHALSAHQTRVSDPDHLPWRETLGAAAASHPPTAVALLARLEDDCDMYLFESVPVVLQPLIDAGFIDPASALELLSLGGEAAVANHIAVELLDQIPDRVTLTEAVESLSLRIRRDAGLDARPDAAAALISWAEQRAADRMQAIDLLRPYCRPPAASRASRQWAARAPTAESDWDRRHRDADEIVAQADRVEPSGVSDDLATLAELYGAERIAWYLERVADHLIPSQREEFIQVLGSIAADHPVARRHADDVLGALIRAAASWGAYPSLAQAIAAAITQSLETHAESVLRYRGTTSKVLSDVLSTAVLDDPLSLIVRAIGASLEHLSPGPLFAAAGELAQGLGEAERVALLSWSLTALEADEPSIPSLPDTLDAALAWLFWSLFGAPDKVTRWRAAHVARALMRRGEGDLGRALLDLHRRRDAGAFASTTSPFHWLSAQTWALMTIARACGDSPEKLSPLAADLTAIAFDKSWPHVAVREFARRGALRLTAAGPLKPELLEELQFINAPRACVCARKPHYGRTGSGTRDYNTERFHFDSMDTLPYVYGPFGDRFGLDVDEITDRAERWLIDRLGLSDVRVRDKRLERLDYSQRDNSHGRSPRGESWRQMLEEHALQLVAGELVDSGAEIYASDYDECPDPWKAWLSAWTDAYEHGWVVDDRDPVPATPALLLRDTAGDQWGELTATELDRAINRHDPDTLIVDSSVQFTTTFGWGSTSVASALVSPLSARALVRALQMAEDPRHYGLPYERGRSYQDDIAIGELRLTGWLWEESPEDEGLEHHDPLRRISLTVTRPGNRFLEVCGGTVERGGRLVRGPDGSPIAWQRSWSDVDEARHPREDPRGTTGMETLVCRRSLAQFLRSTDLLLLLKVSATRHKRRDRLKEEEIDEHVLHGIYLFDPVHGLVG